MADIGLKQDIAFDFQSLSGLRREVQNTPQQGLRAVARQMEGIFVQMMMKSMREALPGDSLLDNDSSRLYTSLYDQQISQDLSNKGLGFADAIVRQLGDKTAAPAAAPHALAAQQTPLMLNPAAIGAFNAPGPEHARAYRGPSAAPGLRDGVGFIQRLEDAAKSVVKGLGLSHHVVLAMAALESGWGKREIPTRDGKPSHNLFGIKADPGWKGESTEITTTEYFNGIPRKIRDHFRVYDSYQQSLEDYVGMLNGSPRYQSVMQATTPEAAARALQQAGYATDPHYAQKLINIIQQIKNLGHQLTQESSKAVAHYQTDLSSLF